VAIKMTEEIFNRDEFEKQWIDKFIILNQRKPTRLERMSFKVGFNAGEIDFKQKVRDAINKCLCRDCNLVKKELLKELNLGDEE
jgi:hypothetical protein